MAFNLPNKLLEQFVGKHKKGLIIVGRCLDRYVAQWYVLLSVKCHMAFLHEPGLIYLVCHLQSHCM